MLPYVLNRLLLAIPTLIGVSFVTFILGYLSPGSPVDVMLGQHADPELRRRLEHEFGLDRPAMVQYGSYVWNAIQGDLGRSYSYGQMPVSQMIAQKFPVTAFLAVCAMALAALTGIPAGIAAAIRHNRPTDRLTMVAVLLLIPMPTFVLAPMLMLVFSLHLGWLPSTGWNGFGDPSYWILPVLVLAARPTALLARYMRSSVLEVIRQDYIRAALAKGLSPTQVVVRHAIKNAFLPVLTVMGNVFGYLLTGSFVVESIFSVPGIGSESVQSIFRRDYPVIQGVALLVAVVFILVNLVVDLLYGAIDPRVRFEEGR